MIDNNNMIDTTKEKILNATFKLISEKGYTSTTTKDIARVANVNEVTIFRKFQNKKGIIIYALKDLEWFPELKDNIFDKCCWSLENDLKMFANIYYTHFTKENAKVIIGLRDPQIFYEVKEDILKLPNSFKNVLIEYFRIMYEMKKITFNEFEILAAMFISINFGFIFTKASFDNEFISINDEKYIEESIKIFAKGVSL